MKNKLFIALIALTCLTTNAYAKHGGSSGDVSGGGSGDNGRSACDLISNKYEDLDCVEASEVGPVCDFGAEIISSPKGRLQLCCCTRKSDSEGVIDPGADTSVDGNVDPSVDLPTDLPVDSPAEPPTDSFVNFPFPNF